METSTYKPNDKLGRIHSRSTQGHPRLHNECEAHLGDMRTFLKEEEGEGEGQEGEKGEEKKNKKPLK